MSHPTHDRHEEEEEEDNIYLAEGDVEEILEDDGGRPDFEEDAEEDHPHEEGKEVGDLGEALDNIELEAKRRRVVREDNSWGSIALHDNLRSIFALSLHPKFPNPPLAITGGQDDTGFIFAPIPPSASASSSELNSSTFLPVRLTGHTDSLACASWNHDGEMVATGGMDGRVRVWRRVRKSRGKPLTDEELEAKGMEAWRNWEFLDNLETGSEIEWLTWHPKGNVLSAGCNDASVWMWSLPSGNTLNVFSAHTMPLTAGAFPPPFKNLLTSSLDSSLILWDPRSTSPIWKINTFLPPNITTINPGIHGTTSIAVSPRGDIAAVGGANGLVKVVHLIKGEILTILKGHRQGESVESLAFVDLIPGGGDGGKGLVIVSGGTDGKGFVWDVITGRVRSEINHSESITSLAPHPAPNTHLLTTSSIDGTLKTWDIRTGTLVAAHAGHSGGVLCVAVAPLPSSSEEGDEGKSKVAVVSADDEGYCKIWKV
ncbi:hypothetical protein IAR50_000150 [Cryptococcus sp. DSM 104548]